MKTAFNLFITGLFILSFDPLVSANNSLAPIAASSTIPLYEQEILNQLNTLSQDSTFQQKEECFRILKQIVTSVYAPENTSPAFLTLRQKSLFEYTGSDSKPFFYFADPETEKKLKQLDLAESLVVLYAVCHAFQITAKGKSYFNPENPLRFPYISMPVPTDILKAFAQGTRPLAVIENIMLKNDGDRKQFDSYTDVCGFHVPYEPISETPLQIHSETASFQMYYAGINENNPYNKRVLGTLELDGNRFYVTLTREMVGWIIEIFSDVDGSPGWMCRDYSALKGYLAFDCITDEKYLYIHKGPSKFFVYHEKIPGMPDFIYQAYMVEQNDHALLLDPSIQRRGIGGLFMVLAMAYAYDQLKMEMISVSEPTPDGEMLYQKMGLQRYEPHYMASLMANDHDGYHVAIGTPFPREYVLGMHNVTYQGNLAERLHALFGVLQWRFTSISDPWLYEFLRQQHFEPLQLLEIKNPEAGTAIKTDGKTFFPVRFTLDINQPQQNPFPRAKPRLFVVNDKTKTETEIPLINMTQYDENGGRSFNLQANLPLELAVNSEFKIKIRAEGRYETPERSFTICVPPTPSNLRAAAA